MHYVHGSDIAESLVNEVLKLASSEEWKPLNSQGPVRSFYLPSPEGSEILTTMIESIIPAPVEFAHSIINLTNPVAWTATCTKSDVIERYDHMNTIVHLRTISMFFGGQALETLFFRTVHVELSKKLFVQAYRSIENDQFKFEEGSIVLAFQPSAWILDVPSNIDSQHCRLRLITQTDPANTVGGVIPGFTSIAALLRNPGAGFGDAYMYLRNYILEHMRKDHPDPLTKIGLSMETEWADAYCSMNEACGWTAHIKKFGISVYSKMDLNGNNIIGVKGSYHCPRPMNEVFESFDLQNCCKWEPFFESASVIQKVDETLNLIRLKSRSTLSQTITDHCLLTIVRKVIGNLGVIMFRSASHESVPQHDTYLLPSGISFHSSEFGGCIVSFMLQGFFSPLDPALYAPIMGARVGMSIANHLNYVAANYENTTLIKQFKDLPGWIPDLAPRKSEGAEFMQQLQPLCKKLLDDLSSTLRQNYPHTSVAGKRKRTPSNSPSITTINTDHIAAKKQGQFVRPFIFLVSNKDARNKHLKRVSMASSHSVFDYLGPDILSEILQYLGVRDAIAFSQVCKNFHFFTTGNRAIWKVLFKKRYGGVYGSCMSCHGARASRGGGGGEKAVEKSDHSSLATCDSFDDWREALIAKIREEKEWRVGALDSKLLRGHEGTIKHMFPLELENSPFLCTADSSVIKVWCLESNQCVSTITPPAPVIGIQHHRTSLVVGCTNGTLQFYNPLPHKGGEEWECTQDNDFSPATLDGFLCMDPITVIYAGPKVHVFDNHTGQRSTTYQDHSSPITSMICSRNETLLYSACRDGKLVIRDLRTASTILPQTVLQPHAHITTQGMGLPGQGQGQSVTALTWTKRDARLATAGHDSKVYYWDLANLSRPVSTLAGHAGPITCLNAFDRYKMVSGGKDKTVRIWSALDEVGEELRMVDGFEGKVSSICMFHNTLFTGSCKGDLRRWSFEM